MKQVLKIIGGFLIGILMGLVVAGVGLVLFRDMSFSEYVGKFLRLNAMEVIGIPLLSLVFFLIAVSLQVVLHEAGHLVCGLASGYRFVSFRIFSFTWIRQGGKVRMKRFSVSGTGGQCLLVPPEKSDEEIPVTLYNIGGVAMNFLTVLVALVPLVLVDDMPFLWKMFLIQFMGIGVFLGLLNGIPMKLGGIGNDAYSLRLLKRNPGTKRALVLQLRINALIQEGMRPKEMPEAWFRLERKIDYSDMLQATVALMEISQIQDREEWKEAYVRLEEAVSHSKELVGILKQEAEAELLFTTLVIGKEERARELATDKLLAYIRTYSKVSSAKQRQLFAIALYMEHDKEKAEEIYRTVKAKRESYLMQGEVNMNLALMESLFSKC